MVCMVIRAGHGVSPTHLRQTCFPASDTRSSGHAGVLTQHVQQLDQPTLVSAAHQCGHTNFDKEVVVLAETPEGMATGLYRPPQMRLVEGADPSDHIGCHRQRLLHR